MVLGLANLPRTRVKMERIIGLNEIYGITLQVKVA